MYFFGFSEIKTEHVVAQEFYNEEENDDGDEDNDECEAVLGTIVTSKEDSEAQIESELSNDLSASQKEYTKPVKVMINDVLTGIYIDNRYFGEDDVLPEIPESAFISDISLIYQKDLGLLTGCEIVSGVMVLNYYLDRNIDAEKAMQHLQMGKAPYWTSKGKFGGDPEVCFVGNPFAENGYGCYSPALAKMLRGVLDEFHNTLKVNNITNCQSEELFYHVSQGKPVIVWATGNLMTPKKNIVYTGLETGRSITWLAGEHCMVLVGYDEKNVYLNCPLYGQVAYEKDKFILRWEQMGRQAIIIGE